MTVEEIFKTSENGTLTLEQFNEAVKKADAKFVDLSTGEYVSVNKHNSEMEAKDKQIEELNGTISSRDKDLEDIKKQLENAGQDADKLASLSTEFTNLQKKYDDDKKAYEGRLSSQAREFAIKEFAANKKFTSSAAKRDYIESMKSSSDVKLSKGGQLVGADVFDADYGKANEDAFVIEKDPEPAPEPAPVPQFINPTPGGEPAPTESNAFLNAFNFTGVRPIPKD